MKSGNYRENYHMLAILNSNLQNKTFEFKNESGWWMLLIKARNVKCVSEREARLVCFVTA